MERKGNRRSLTGLVVRPDQVKSIASVTSLTIAMTGALVVCVVVSFKGLVQRLGETANSDPELAFIFHNTLVSGLAVIVGAAVLVAILVMFLLVRSHRFYGPLVPLQRHINKLTEGDYTSRVVLRRDDELTELRDSLNKLAETLQARKK